MAAPVFVADEIVTAAKMNSLPKGILGYAEVTANQTGIGAETDLTGLSVTVDVAANRRVRITGHAVLSQVTTTGIITGYIKESTTKLGRWVMHSGTTGEFILGDGSCVLAAPSTGSHTYKLSLSASAGTVSMSAAAGDPGAAFILVEDIGGV